MIFFPAPTVNFYSENDIINEEYPIYPAKDHKRNWVQSCAKAFAKYKNIVNNKATVIGAARCPGMRGIMNCGYIMQSWFDFTIETNENGYKIYYPTELENYLKKINYFNFPPIKTFNTKTSPLKIPIGNNFHEIFKIYIPYSFEVPKGYKLLILPIFYEDNPNFTACSGYTDGYTSDFNVHIFWHIKKGIATVKAGTPLCQLIPIKENSPTLQVFKESKNKIMRARKESLNKYNKFILHT